VLQDVSAGFDRIRRGMFMILFTDSAPRGPAAVDILWKKPEFCGKNLNYLGITKTQDIVFLISDFFLPEPRYFLKLFLGKLLNHLIYNAIVR
jgi:hypothetical protein